MRPVFTGVPSATCIISVSPNRRSVELMAAARDRATAEPKDWHGTPVPDEVYHALTTTWRGQTGIAAKQAVVLRFFDEKAVLKGAGQQELTGGGGSSEAPALTAIANVVTEFRVKGDPRRDPVAVAKCGQINPTRMIKYVLASTHVSDEDKVALCTGRKAMECVKWLEEFNERSKKKVADAQRDTAVAEADVAALLPSERNILKRQQVLDGRVVHSLTSLQITAVQYALCTFFFLCRIPFMTIEHWAFVLFVKALNPAYVPHLFKRTCLSTTWLSTLRAETQEKTEAHLERCMGKKTIIVDGFKDRRGRHVMNISEAKVGFAAYSKTAWFGRRSHGGETYFKEIESLAGDGDEYIACCADNTSSNTSMQSGLFGRLSRKYSWFFLGCCVHCMDLLSEDVAKMPEIASVIGDFKLVTGVVLRFSLLTETFIDLQVRRHKADRSASKIMLKTFPDTRFAYAFFVVYAVLLNWTVLQSLVDSPEYKVLKANAKPSRRAVLRKFELIVGDPNKRNLGNAVVAVMRPISSVLHYLEGSDVDASHVLPLYVLLHQQAQSPCDDVKEELTPEAIATIAGLFKDRWNGAGRKVGIRNDLHCLAWKLDLHARYVVLHSSSNGGELLAAIDGSFGLEPVMRAIKTYSQGNDTTHAQLVAEYESFTSKTGVWALKHTSAELLVKTKLAKILTSMKDVVKNNPVTRITELLKCRELTVTRIMYKSMVEDASVNHELKLFVNMGVGTYLTPFLS